MIALFALCVFSLRKPKVVRSNLTRRFHSPKSVKIDVSSECDFTGDQADEWIADCQSGLPCTWGHTNCPALDYKDDHDYDEHERCVQVVCNYICYDDLSQTVKDWCYPTQPNENWKVDDWKKYFERGKEGKCDGTYDRDDDEIQEVVDECKKDEDACKKMVEYPCKGAWKAGDKYEEADCWIQYCDAICNKKRFSWCGLSAGAIAGTVIACVVVVGGVAGGLFFFFVIMKKKDEGTPK
jgi:hypothetical protein